MQEKNMQPELSFKVSNVIQECWKAGENKELGSELMVSMPDRMKCSCRRQFD